MQYLLLGKFDSPSPICGHLLPYDASSTPGQAFYTSFVCGGAGLVWVVSQVYDCRLKPHWYHFLNTVVDRLMYEERSQISGVKR